MSRPLFVDACSLINLKLIDRLDLLPALFPTRQWTATIRRECIAAPTHDPRLDNWLAELDDILGAPLIPNDDEHRAIEDLRLGMSTAGDHPDKHRGEAETLTIIDRRRIDAFFLTDDGSAQALCTYPPYYIPTAQFLRLACRRSHLTPAEAVSACYLLIDAGRSISPTIKTHAQASAAFT